jgi:hypothetical protein
MSPDPIRDSGDVALGRDDARVNRPRLRLAILAHDLRFAGTRSVGMNTISGRITKTPRRSSCRPCWRRSASHILRHVL